MRLRQGVATAVFLCAGVLTAQAAPLSVPFDFTRGAIGLDVSVNGTPLYMILDTGVDPSVIDLARAARATHASPMSATNCSRR